MPVGNVKPETTVSGWTVPVDPYDRPGPRGRSACGGAHLQRVRLASAEGQPEDLLHPCRADFERAVAGQPPHVLITRAVSGAERVTRSTALVRDHA